MEIQPDHRSGVAAQMGVGVSHADHLRVIDGTPRSEEEERLLSSLRPRTLDEFIGQNSAKARLDLAIRAARALREPLDHLLLAGPPGLGKTSMANIVANAMGSTLITTSAPMLNKDPDILGILTSLSEGDVLFIDEIHRLPHRLEEHLYPAMEDFRLDMLLPPTTIGGEPRVMPWNLPKFTLIGATTRKGMLSPPLRDRFGLDLTLQFYDDASLTRIVERSALIMSMTIDSEAAGEVARRSRGTPRIANRLLRRVRDYAVVHATVPTLEMVHDALEMQGVDRHGLDELDRRYLAILIGYYSGHAGVSALAATMQESVNTLEDAIEPFLLTQGYILRTATGRQATEKAKAAMKGTAL